MKKAKGKALDSIAKNQGSWNQCFIFKTVIAKCCSDASIQTSQQRIAAVELSDEMEKVFISELGGAD